MTRLTKERENILRQYAPNCWLSTSTNPICELLAEIAALRADLKRLRQASEDFIGIIDEPEDDNDSYEAMAYRKLYKIISCDTEIDDSIKDSMFRENKNL